MNYQEKAKQINRKYVPKSLSPTDKKKQIKSIVNKTERPKTKYPKRRSSFVINFQKKYGYSITDPRVERELISSEGIKQIMNKARGAFYSSGSRPNTNPTQWAYARLASVLMGGSARKIDQKIYDKYKK